MADHESLLAATLALVPTHRQSPATAQALAEALSSQVPGLGADAARATVQTALDLLAAFGAVRWQGDGVRAAGQAPAYFIRSLRWFLHHNAAVVEDAKTLSGDALTLRQLLRHMELRRVQLAQEMSIPAEPSREQDAALVLFTKTVRGRPCLLFQWDERARQYQLIGGRVEPGETPAEAAVRECIEEIGASQPTPWEHPRDFSLALLPSDQNIIELTAISATYGALTRYRFHMFHARVHHADVTLGPHDRWIAIDHMQRRNTRKTPRLGDEALYAALQASIDGGLAALPSSFVRRVQRARQTRQARRA